MKPTLVVLAAGLGSRYGGLKQMDSMGPNGESIIDYSVYDAIQAGFGKVVFVLREEIVDDFYELFANRYKKFITVEHAVQRLTDIPSGIGVNPDRVKPWGTGHAVLAAARLLTEPFAVINGDDYYGTDAFKVMAEFLSALDSKAVASQSMVGYNISNTLSENGAVARGICSVDDKMTLTGVVERTHIERKNGTIIFLDENEKEFNLVGNEIVSMNFWGFTPAILPYFQTLFEEFLKQKGNELKSEFFIPYAVNLLIKSQTIAVKVLESNAQWFGVTYQADKPHVQEKITEMYKKGLYPEKLW
ncbi:MAG: sugar phosphate nucleotidyltransferase [Bacteroidales bacterium]|nr:sugar phosphate nucleotidyltransferase [Bacteroidales bacterium]